MSINWYPGHMHKATKAIRAILPTIDLIVEILDARIPYSSQNPVIRDLESSHKRLKLLNKKDLADPAFTDIWLQHYQQQPATHAIALSLTQENRAQGLIHIIQEITQDLRDRPGAVNVLITGIPNVGKSTLINALAARKSAKTGNEPAVTRDIQKINPGHGIMLFDSPGILWPKIENSHSGFRLAVTGAIRDTAIRHDDVACYAADYLLENYQHALENRFDFPTGDLDGVTFLETLGIRRGCLAGRGAVDFDKVSKLFLQEIRSGQLGGLTFETPAMADREEIEVALEKEKKAKIKVEKQKAKKQAFRKRKQS